MAVLTVVILAVIIAVAAVEQAVHGHFRSLKPLDLAVIAAMLFLVTLMDLVPTQMQIGNFLSIFNVSGTVFVAVTIGYGAITGIIVATIGTLITELFARREPQKLVFNVADFIAASGLAGIVYHLLASDTNRVPLESTKTLLAALIASIVYLMVNNTLFSFVIGAAIGKSPLTVFLDNAPGQLLQNITLPPIGLLLTTVRELSPLTVLIALIPLLGPYIAMRGYREIQIQIQRTIEALADTVDRRDITTAQHSERVANYTRQIIDELGTIRFVEAEAIILAARVHDLGKIAIPDAVLLKPGKLDEGEYWLMRQHPVAGDDILQKLSIYKDSLGVVRHHHERFDGRGYPDGIKGEEIPFGARIVSVADSYDVMTSDRPYARARTISEGIEELIACKGTHFDPKIVDAFVHVLDRQHAPESSAQRAPAPSVVSAPVA